jgi:hypothetical protein
MVSSPPIVTRYLTARVFKAATTCSMSLAFLVGLARDVEIEPPAKECEKHRHGREFGRRFFLPSGGKAIVNPDYLMTAITCLKSNGADGAIDSRALRQRLCRRDFQPAHHDVNYHP